MRLLPRITRRQFSGNAYRQSPRARPLPPPISNAPKPPIMSTEIAGYANWSNADLIRRVTELEGKLRALNSQHANTPSSSSSPTPSKKRPKRAAKTFDPSKYSTRHIALKFAYLGKNYNGFEHHTNNTTPLPTVEEELWKALRKTYLIFPNFREGQSEDEVCWDGCDYSKCGRTDRGVSAFGQVMALRVRSSEPRKKAAVEVTSNGTAASEDGGSNASAGQEMDRSEEDLSRPSGWGHVKDELPYIQILNRVLPPDIRMLAWCPSPSLDFSARFSCKERRYRYFFTNPAYAPTPGERDKAASKGAWLNIDAMRMAAKKLEGLHDFRNFCKIDGSKQISNFERRIFQADIKPVVKDQEPLAFLCRSPFAANSPLHREDGVIHHSAPNLFYFEVHGSAFLWHQVRHMIAVLFLVGQGFEDPSIVDKLLDVQTTPSRPIYDMASDTPLVLWDCIFPDPETVIGIEHADGDFPGYKDALEWIYAGDLADVNQASSRKSIGTEDRKYGSLSIMDNLWSTWKTAKIDEVLSGSLMNVFARQGNQADASRGPDLTSHGNESARVFDGSESPRSVGSYISIMQRKRLETPAVINARFAARKGWTSADVEGDADE
jgi:tRNA pseudouridine38/39 synthase